eukprot:COSAG02_NODE_8860_length_2418_cov_2.103062_5_plen_52_part_00
MTMRDESLESLDGVHSERGRDFGHFLQFRINSRKGYLVVREGDWASQPTPR